MDYIPVIRDFIVSLARHADYSESDIYKIALSVDEACTNVLEHAFNPNEPYYNVEVVSDHKKIEIIVYNNGKPFHLPSRNKADVEKQITGLKTGNLGLFIIQNIMDNVFVENKSNQNSLHMIKFKHTQN